MYENGVSTKHCKHCKCFWILLLSQLATRTFSVLGNSPCFTDFDSISDTLHPPTWQVQPKTLVFLHIIFLKWFLLYCSNDLMEVSFTSCLVVFHSAAVNYNVVHLLTSLQFFCIASKFNISRYTLFPITMSGQKVVHRYIIVAPIH